MLLAALAATILTPAPSLAWTTRGNFLQGVGKGKWEWSALERGKRDFVLRIEEPATQADGVELMSFAKYSGMENLGGYEAALQVDEHRVWLSSKWGEAVLWSSQGGILAVAPYPVKTEQDHRIGIATTAGKTTFSIDGNPLLMWPSRSPGKVALGVKEGRVRFTIAQTPAEAKRPLAGPATVGFREQNWHGQSWFFDGREPLFTLAPGNRMDHMKLRSGHRPMMYAANFATDWATCTPTKVESLKVLKQGATLHLQVQASDPAHPTSKSLTDLIVSKDRWGFYTFDHKVRTTTQSRGLEWDHGDPAFLGAVGDTVTVNAEPYRPPLDWFLFDIGGGKVFRTPLNHNGHYVSKNFPGAGTYGSAGGRMVAFGSAPIAPVVVVPPVPASFKGVKLDTCFWGFDEHILYTLAAPSGEIETQVLYTAMARSEAVKLFETSTLNEPIDPQLKVPVYTAGIGNTETFGKEVVLATPHREFRLWAGKLDKNEGHGDRSSLRIDGPGEAGTGIGPSNYMAPWPDRARVSCWLKLDTGTEEPSIGISRTDNGQTNIYPIGDPKVRGWQKAEFVADFQAGVPIATVTFRNAGGGTVWFDDFKIQAASPGAPVTLPAAPKGDVVLNWSFGNAPLARDTSGFGHSGKLFNVGVGQEGDQKFWQFKGDDSYAWPLPSPALDLAPPYSLEFELRPYTEGSLFSYYFQFYFALVPNGEDFSIEYRGKGPAVKSMPCVKRGKWQKVRITATEDALEFFVDGKSYGRHPATIAPAVWSLYQSGSWHRHPSFFGNGPGDLLFPPDFAACMRADVRSVKLTRGGKGSLTSASNQ